MAKNSQAEIYLQWSFVYLKNQEYTRFVYDFIRAHNLYKENLKKFPDFNLNNKGLSIIRALLGAVPNEYQWMLDVIGLKGDIKLGEVRSTTNGVLNKCQTSNQLSSMGLDSIILPGKTITPRKKIELSALPELDTIEAVAEATEDTDLSNPNIFSQYGVVFQKTKTTESRYSHCNLWFRWFWQIFFSFCFE